MNSQNILAKVNFLAEAILEVYMKTPTYENFQTAIWTKILWTASCDCYYQISLFRTTLLFVTAQIEKNVRNFYECPRVLKFQVF